MPGIKIKINHTHIAKAIKGDGTHCMISLAIQEKFPDVRWVWVDKQTIRWTDRKEGKRYFYLTPRPAQRALLRFDNGEPIEPFPIALSGPFVRPIHPLTHRKIKKPNKSNRKKPNTARYKHKKTAPEASAVRRYGLRAFGEN